VIYQVYTRSFQDSNGDGIGDLEGVIQRLDYLAALGVDVIWLSPLHPGPNIDLGYDGTDYLQVAPEFGTLDVVDRLVTEAKRRGIRIMMDLVLDYTSTAHPWFVQARSSRTSPFYDWYIWRDGAPDQPPNDWTAFFSSGSAWTFNQPTRSWYLHYFTVDQPELNWANPHLRQAMHDVMRFWLSRGVAGFRLDVISFLSKPPLDQNLPDEFRSAPGRFYANGPELHAYLREIRAVLDEFPGTVALGEGFGIDLADAPHFVAPQRRELDLMFLFNLSALTFAETAEYRRPDLAQIREALERVDTILSGKNAWPTVFLGNHDVARMLNRFGNPEAPYRAASAKLLITLLLTLRGTPVIYQGDEIGMVNTRFDTIGEFRDIAVWNAWTGAGSDEAARNKVLSRARQVGRDTGRGAVRWTGDTRAGFTTGTPWIKVDPDLPGFSVAEQEDDDESPLRWTRRLSELRRASPALRSGSLDWLEAGPQILCFERGRDAERWRIILNWSDEPADCGNLLANSRAALSSLAREPGSSPALGPWEAVLVRL